MENGKLLEARKIGKRFGPFEALSNVDLQLERGEKVLILGPNGAGKSTLCRILALLSKPSSGTLLFKGERVSGDIGKAYKSVLGYLSHRTMLYSHLSAEENLLFFASLHQVRDSKKIHEMMDAFGLSPEKRRLAGTMSRGMQQRLSIARLLLTDPEILLLDEPFTGLDPDGARQLAEAIYGQGRGDKTVLTVTQDLRECPGSAERVLILKKGRIYFDGQIPPGGNLESLYSGISDGEMQ